MEKHSDNRQKREKGQKYEWPPENTGKPFVLTLWVRLRVGRHQLGKGAQVACCIIAAAFRHHFPSQTNRAAFKEPSGAVIERRDEKATLVSAFPMSVFQRCHLMKIWALITFKLGFHFVCIVSKTDAKSNTSSVVSHGAARNCKDSSQRQCQQGFFNFL